MAKLQENSWITLRPFKHGQASTVSGVKAFVTREQGGGLTTRWHVDAPLAELKLNTSDGPRRSDGLWRTTCFELFVAGAGSAYYEYNLAHSGDWACYSFDDYRSSASNVDMVAPIIGYEDDPAWLWMDTYVTLPPDLTAAPLTLNIAAVIETTDGALSHWALAHPADKPDFHDRSCFRFYLPAAA